MPSRVYFALLAAVLGINAALSFYHASIARANHLSIIDMIAFQKQGARYTYDDGVRDRADRDRIDAELAARITALEESK
jgi:hypothetical protein